MNPEEINMSSNAFCLYLVLSGFIEVTEDEALA
jgi:hypothetical protein